ncbi:N-acetylmuramoyl-L-alanine amidase [Entomospira nematocerorum]|uniref:N-acetylmuramoyl-L-alanine amidase n=1 Tax=Entomospira nematocerorum TaxID=2719987 RepID=UPI0024817896|nr:N-acetylmuramoyl-L-alanine amidase [Entomospira nematocera]WDI34317.1 N-acetylmuramoyl-L-alanine amidase [Entomospira nematocera]
MSLKTKLGIILLITVIYNGCNHGYIHRSAYYVDSSRPSITFDSRVQYLIMHYTAVDEEESFRLLTTESWPASAHYLVTEDPKQKNHQPVVYQLVSENERAWHAGVSRWGENSRLNSASIGIEIVNLGYIDIEPVFDQHNSLIEDGYHVWEAENRYWFYYDPAQIEAVKILAKDIVDRYNIEPQHVLGHTDIAPLRKSDPGPLFPWRELYDAGIGAWYDDDLFLKYLGYRELDTVVSTEQLLNLLKLYGYASPAPIDERIPSNQITEEERLQYEREAQLVIRAFQMHFRPTNFSGIADAETEAIILALLEKYYGVDIFESILS